MKRARTTWSSGTAWSARTAKRRPTTSWTPRSSRGTANGIARAGTDKFLGSTLDPILKEAGIKTVIICGNSFQGATVGTTQQAAQRGYKIIVPVDCSAGEDEYHEQYATFHLAKGSLGGGHQQRHADAQHDDQILGPRASPNRR